MNYLQLKNLVISINIYAIVIEFKKIRLTSFGQ
jgi:hypothetical protein